MGAAESALLNPVPVERAVVLAAVSPGLTFSGFWVRIGSPTTRRRSPPVSRPRPAAWRSARGRQGQALRARLRASLTAPARDASFALAGRDEQTTARPNKETAPTQPPDRRGMTANRSRPSKASVGWMKGGLLRGGAFPFPCAVERRGTGTGNGIADQRSARL